MTIKDNVYRLWRENRPDIKSVAELERKTDLSNGTISRWDKSIPSTRSAQKVADFFHVPLSQVLGNSDDKATKLDSQEQQFLTLFRKNTESMTSTQKEKFTNSLDTLMQAAKNIIDNKKKGESD